eukprot:sb/3470418/
MNGREDGVDPELINKILQILQILASLPIPDVYTTSSASERAVDKGEEGRQLEEEKVEKEPERSWDGTVPTDEAEGINERKEERDKEWKWKEDQRKERKQDSEIMEEHKAQYKETIEKEREERNRKAKERKRERDRVYQANKRAERREYRNRYGIDMIKKKKEGPRTRNAVYSRRYREKKKREARAHEIFREVEGVMFSREHVDDI